MVNAMCGVQLEDGKIAKDLMLVFALNVALVLLAVVSSVHWYGYVLRRDGHILRRALVFEVEGQRKRGRPMGTWKKQVEEESVNVGLRREDELFRSKWNFGINRIASGLRRIRSPSLDGDAA